MEKKELVVQPALAYCLFQRREATSWRPWGGLFSQADVDREAGRIEEELGAVARRAEFPIRFLPVARVASREQAAAVCGGSADVMLMYGATSGGDVLEALISPERYNLLFVRHRSGPVYLWYEIAHPILLRKQLDEFGQPGLETADVVVDEYDDVLWRLRALYALKNTVGSRIVALGSASGWGAGGRNAPAVAAEKWKMDIREVSYEELGKRIQSARADAGRVARAKAEAAAYLGERGVTLNTDRGFVERAFLLTEVFEELMAELESQAFTINHCMGTVMPISETTACLPLTLINDSGALAFCESDFVVIPSGVLLHHIAGTPVFLQDPTYPHHGVVTLAHCTAPRKMDGKHLEKVSIETHFESDYGAAPKVEMRKGQVITVIDPNFGANRWLGFRGRIVDNPFLAICRSQVDVAIEGDWERLVEEMGGFHWMLAYGDHRREVGYALRKMGIEWADVSAEPPGRRA
ncbi:MAG: sugar isomerase [Candidatus Hydrogenedentes bacterium]|nr:sugar isomerase [Candidatus Hydrogenedentota bacterium]